jgi:hypothetical protein
MAERHDEHGDATEPLDVTPEGVLAVVVLSANRSTPGAFDWATCRTRFEASGVALKIRSTGGVFRGSTERRRSRTDRAVGCTTARVLKSG